MNTLNTEVQRYRDVNFLPASEPPCSIKKNRKFYKSFLLLISILSFLACEQNGTHFTLIAPEKSGITFSNTIFETDSIHYFNFPYIYTGGGVGIGDFNKDGLPDIFFSGNMVSSKLYLNEGDFQFRDISKEAGIETKHWATGVSIIDINQDSWPDIYLSVGGYGSDEVKRNLLFINNQDMSFTESAAQYGIADEGHSTQSAFFDYDLDGDLDLYVMTHANESYANISKLYTIKDGKGPSTDRLYQNIGSDSLGHPFYRNVSQQAGITIEGYGLGLAISDLNQDGWPDIYVANDFISNDLIYLNQRDGTFINQLAELTQHSSQNGMGVDIADINNDGLPDIIVMDMLPESNHRQKTMTANANNDFVKRTLSNGFSPQFIRNTLQVHQGLRPNGNPSFSEVGRMAGVHQTDWSWAPLFADFDNDGLLDLYITNGFRRDVTDHDFQEFHEDALMHEQGSGELSMPKVLQKLFQLDSVYLPNYIFQNRGGLLFEDQTKASGMGQASMSNGAAYADFDQDGDLDLVVNNLNAPAFLYRNESSQNRQAHYLTLTFAGKYPNREGIGTKVTLHLADGSQLSQENYPVRGYMSSVQAGVHFGLGEETSLSLLEIVWPDGFAESYTDLLTDSVYAFTYGKGTPLLKPSSPNSHQNSSMFREVSNKRNIHLKHRENSHSDFKLEPLLAHQYDYHGPGIAVGDIHGDSKEDFYIGGARGQEGSLFLQNGHGTFSQKNLEGSEFYEDMGALLFDADQDEDLDLYVVSGGSSVKYFQKGHYQDRLYRNDGEGNYSLDSMALPEIRSSGSCVIAEDFDQDGDLDLFVGGRVVPGKFPISPRSYLLENKEGKFEDVTEKLAPGLAEVGMVCSALWTDYDNDQDADLMIVGEWMPIALFQNNDGKFNPVNVPAFQDKPGLWNSLAGADMDQDGDIDYVAGNWGENTSFKARSKEPLRVYAKDFDENGSIDAILTRFIQGKEYPIAPRGAMINQLESIKRLFPKYQEYAEADIHQILSAYDTSNLAILEANYLSSSYIENLGEGNFNISALPREAQLAPLFGLQLKDVNADGKTDILAIGNFSATEVISGGYDAHKGLLLIGDGAGDFNPMSISEAGLWLEGDARALSSMATADGENLFLATINNDSLRVFVNDESTELKKVPLLPDERSAEILFKNGYKRKYECYLGEGYLSQSSCVLEIDEEVLSVKIFNLKGESRSLRFD